MAVVTWYRGFALGDTPAPPNAAGMSDIGNGIYFTSDFQAARDYGRLRDAKLGKGTMIYQVEIDMSRFRVLDLTSDPRWIKYLQQRITPNSPQNVDLMRMRTENYVSFFQDFCKQNNVNLSGYDIVMGDDFHSGASGRRTTQMVVLYKGFGYTTVHGEVMGKMQLVEKNGIAVRAVVDPTRVVGGANTTAGAAVRRQMLNGMSGAQRLTLDREELQGRAQRVVDDQQAAANSAQLRWTGYAVVVSKIAFALNDAALEYRVKEELIKRQTEVTQAFERKQGVLVIVHVAMEKHSESGFLARGYQNLWLEPATTPDEALTRWRARPGYFDALPANAPYRYVEEYRWLEVGEEI